MRMSARHVALFLVLAMVGPVAAAQDALTAKMGKAARGLAGTLNRIARARDEDGAAPLEVAVRTARMHLAGVGEEGMRVRCSALGRVLRDELKEKLDDVRTSMGGFDFRVRAVDVGDTAVTEVNTEWWLDTMPDGEDVMTVRVRVKVREELVGGSEMNFNVPADALTDRQSRCLMRWEPHAARWEPVPDGRFADVFEGLELGSRLLKTYEEGEKMRVYGNVHSLGGDSWHLVRVEDQDSDRYEYGFRMVQHNTVPDPGQEFRDCAECPEMVVVPAGSYQMGSANETLDERPVHAVTIRARFALGKYEVTFGEWDACARGGGCPLGAADDQGWGRGRRPVVDVSWDDAQRYVRWLSERTGKSYRLPSESEWEYAARSGTETAYSWGYGIGHNRANCDNCGSRWDDERTAPVGSFGSNGWGLHDMHGNVWEWVEDCWNDSYAGSPRDGSAWQSGYCSERVVRGGSWTTRLRATNRHGYSTDRRKYTVGFRVAQTLTP